MRVASVYYRDYAENSLFTAGAGENNGEFCLTPNYANASWLRASSSTRRT
jgi:hypothetical protein